MIKIICVGKIKESFYREAVQEYLKRLSKWFFGTTNTNSSRKRARHETNSSEGLRHFDGY